MNSNLRRVGLSCLLFTLLFVRPLPAAQTAWRNTSLGDWFIAGNWSLAVPSTVDTGIIANGGTALLNSPGAFSLGLFVGVPTTTGGITTSTGTLLISGNGGLTVSNIIRIGGSTSAGVVGNGTLTISSGAALNQTAGYTSVGDGNQGSNGTVTVTGFGSSLGTTSSLTLGEGTGRGTLNVQSGGRVMGAGPAAIGSTVGSTGSVTVTGSQSSWVQSGGIFVGGSDSSASGGSGALRILNGGFVQTPLLKQWSTGLAEVDNGSSATPGLLVTGTTNPPAGAGALGDLAVGSTGTGRMEITAGGSLFTNRGYLGFSTGSTGTAFLSGTNSRWSCNGSVWVGNGGEGNLTVTDNAVLTSAGNGYLAFENNAIGNATISNGGRWNTASTLYVGGNSGGPGGSGSLTVRDATLNAGAYVIQNTGGLTIANARLLGPSNAPNPPMTINGGYIQAGADTFFENRCTIGVGGVRFFTAGFKMDVDETITGPGGLTKGGPSILGAGSLYLNNANNYTGPTIVNAGELLVNVSITSPVTVNSGGTLGGQGTVVGSVTVNNNGAVDPGYGLFPGRLRVNGNYNQTNGGLLGIHLGGYVPGTNLDQLAVTGSATIGGTLNVNLINGFTPVVGDTFPILTSNGLTGNFSRINSPGLFLRSDASATGIVLTVLRVGPEISPGGFAIIDAGPNGTLEPGETVTVSLGARKNPGPGGECTTAALTGTLSTGGGVTNPAGAQNYGVICAGDAPTFRSFTFTVDPSLVCGDTIIASIDMTDGAISYGVLTYLFTVGTSVTVLAENFDQPTAPALPADWTSNTTGVIQPWKTSVVTFVSAPNSAFVPNPSTVGNSELISPTFSVPANGAKLTFQNHYATEDTWDGMVLEISIDGGLYRDLLTAGGSFVTGGYNGVIRPEAPSSLAGRNVWTGGSFGYITTITQLPAAANGRNARLKWRMASDDAIAATGVRIDDVSILSPACDAVPPTVISAVSRKTHGSSGPFDIDLPFLAPAGIECRTGGAAGNHQVVVTFANPVSVESVAVTSIDGQASAQPSVNGAEVTLNLTAVANAQTLQITLVNVSNGTSAGDVVIFMGVLAGDTNGSGSVTASDIGQTKSQSGQAATGANFRTDVNASGSITASDIGLVKSKSGSSLP